MNNGHKASDNVRVLRLPQCAVVSQNHRNPMSQIRPPTPALETPAEILERARNGGTILRSFDTSEERIRASVLISCLEAQEITLASQSLHSAQQILSHGRRESERESRAAHGQRERARERWRQRKKKGEGAVKERVSEREREQKRE